MLVFFGLGKWGKLINISEGGMAFEFYQPPPNGQRISFGLEAMNRESSEPSDKLAIDSIQADGQIIWTCDPERCAGVQFLDVSGDMRKQIRQWLSIEPTSGAASEDEKDQHDSIETVLPGRPPTLHQTMSQGTEDRQLWNDELPQSRPKVLARSDFGEQPTFEEPSGAKSRIDRAALITMARWLAILAIIAGITITILSRVHLAALLESIRERSIGNSAPARAGERSVAKSPQVFQVEAVDVNNRRRLLTFDDDASAVEAWLSSGTAAHITKNKPLLVNAVPAESTTAEKRQSLSNLNLGRPTVPRPATNALSKDPTLAIDSGATSRAVIAANPSGGILANIAKQVPAAPTMPVGGQFQQARLISSVPPAYPALARSIGIQGDVTIDALIDSTGKVTTVKPLAGPVPLQQAAMDALQQWKYEPARLNDQPVSMHLSVTMKFRIN